MAWIGRSRVSAGEALHEARPGLFADGVVRALSLYEDALPFRRALQDFARFLDIHARRVQ